MDRARTVAVMFADVAGSTSLYERVGDNIAHQRIDACLKRLQGIVSHHAGRVVKNVGDGVMGAFPSAESALQAAIALQEAQAGGMEGLSLRVGFHAGMAIERDGDLFGDTVNLAARLGDAAKAGQILTTADTVQALAAHLRAGTRAMGTLTLKGKAQPVETCEVVWNWSPDMTMVDLRVVAPPAAREHVLKLAIGGRALEFGAGASVTLGRDQANDLVVPAPRASRMHARIEYRNAKFVLVDFSSNGTFMRIDGERDVVLHREASPLRGRGWIFLGAAAVDPDLSEALRFSCD